MSTSSERMSSPSDTRSSWADARTSSHSRSRRVLCPKNGNPANDSCAALRREQPLKMTPVISVVIPVKDGGAGLVRCLEGIRSQMTDEEAEIVVVDSGSADGSLEAARAAGARVYEIPPHRFSHGAARNLGADRASGEVLVFLSQDAVPADGHWLERLIAPLRLDETVAGVYGRQLPNADASPPEAYFLGFLYGTEPRRQWAASPDQLSMDTTLFSNVNSAIPRYIWQRFPFVED